MNYIFTMKKKNSHFTLYFALFLALCIISGCGSARKSSLFKPDGASEIKGETIRILVAGAQRSIVIKDSQEGAGASVVVKYNSKGYLDIDGKKFESAIFTPQDEFFTVNDKQYRGIIEIVGDLSSTGASRGRKGLNVINELNIDYYIAGLINSEISSKWHPEVLKTQAVIARSYALFQKNKRAQNQYHMTGTDIDQVYKGSAGEDVAALKAVKDTAGEVLVYNGKTALTLYHSNAGGRTEAAEDVWGGNYAYLRSVKSPYDKGTPTYQWSLSISGEVLGEKLSTHGYSAGRVKKIKIKKRTKTGRVKRVLIKSKKHKPFEISGEELRKVVGYARLRSTLFKINKKGRSFEFRGHGSGHGVGLSQWGARGMADSGYSYKKILSHYYPGTKLESVY